VELWHDGALKHFYPESLEPAISARARELMATRDNDVPVAEWMDLIAGSEPTLLDEFQAFEIHDGEPARNPRRVPALLDQPVRLRR
jgi:hypothetical protein